MTTFFVSFEELKAHHIHKLAANRHRFMGFEELKAQYMKKTPTEPILGKMDLLLRQATWTIARLDASLAEKRDPLAPRTFDISQDDTEGPTAEVWALDWAHVTSHERSQDHDQDEGFATRLPFQDFAEERSQLKLLRMRSC